MRHEPVKKIAEDHPSQHVSDDGRNLVFLEKIREHERDKEIDGKVEKKGTRDICHSIQYRDSFFKSQSNRVLRLLFAEFLFAVDAVSRLGHELKPRYGDVLVAFLARSVFAFFDAFECVLDVVNAAGRVLDLSLNRIMAHLLAHVGIDGGIV